MPDDVLQKLITIAISVAGALASLLVVWLKTRTAYLEKKLKQPLTLKGKCILFKCPSDNKTYLLDLDEEKIISKADITYDILKTAIDLDKPKIESEEYIK